jgi:hypothetical protein
VEILKDGRTEKTLCGKWYTAQYNTRFFKLWLKGESVRMEVGFRQVDFWEDEAPRPQPHI